MSLFDIDHRERVGLSGLSWLLSTVRLSATARAFTVHAVDDAGHSKHNLTHPETEFLAALAKEERHAWAEFSLAMTNAARSEVKP